MPRRRRLHDIVQVGLRVREEMRLRIEQEAKRHGVSFNAEVVRRIDESFELREQIKNQNEIAQSFTESVARIVAEITGYDYLNWDDQKGTWRAQIRQGGLKVDQRLLNVRDRSKREQARAKMPAIVKELLETGKISPDHGAVGVYLPSVGGQE